MSKPKTVHPVAMFVLRSPAGSYVDCLGVSEHRLFVSCCTEECSGTPASILTVQPATLEIKSGGAITNC